MATNQGLRQASVRAVTGTALDYNGDWHALFDQAGIHPGEFNGRLLAWINGYLGTSYPDLPGAMQGFAKNRGYLTWDAMGTFNASSAPPPPANITRVAAGTYATSALGTSGGGTLSATPGLPAGLAEGDLMVLCVGYADPTTGLGGVAAWAYQNGYSFFGQGGAAILSKLAGAAEVAPTVTIADGRSGDILGAQIVAYRGGACVVDATEAEFWNVAGSVTASASAQDGLAILFISAEAGATDPGVSYTANAITGWTTVADNPLNVAGSYNMVCTFFERDARVAASEAITGPVPTYSPSDPANGGHVIAVIR